MIFFLKIYSLWIVWANVLSNQCVRLLRGLRPASAAETSTQRIFPGGSRRSCEKFHAGQNRRKYRVYEK